MASGKLMLFGEYLVLWGADCLAFPVKYGQTLTIENHQANRLDWDSFALGEKWLHITLDENLEIVETNDQKAAKTLQVLFLFIQKKQPLCNLFQKFTMTANFNLEWGLGSSSTLIALLSQWAQVDASELLNISFGGSGYDVACATAHSPIVYANGEIKRKVILPQLVTDNLLFIYSGKKQSSKKEIARFQDVGRSEKAVNEMNAIIHRALQSKQIEDFEKEIDASEIMLASILGNPSLKVQKFADYPYSIKSLGAWGGDFFMATFRSLEKAQQYFKHNGFDLMFTYYDLIESLETK